LPKIVLFPKEFMVSNVKNHKHPFTIISKNTGPVQLKNTSPICLPATKFTNSSCYPFVCYPKYIKNSSHGAFPCLPHTTKVTYSLFCLLPILLLSISSVATQCPSLLGKQIGSNVLQCCVQNTRGTNGPTKLRVFL